MTADVRLLALGLLAALAVPTTAPHTDLPGRPRASGQLDLRNDGWDAVRVEVRIGPSEVCDENEVVGIRKLARGRTWAVVADDLVCWRREAQPGSGDGQWTTWESRVVPEGAVEEVSLQP